MSFKKIGILGGMGPNASANFLKIIIEICQKKYNAVQDCEFPEIILNSITLKDFDETGIVNENNVLQQLKEGIQCLKDAGCDFVVMPCNTVHYYIEDLRKNAGIPILSILEETANKIEEDGIEKVGITASETTMKLGLYLDLLESRGIACITPEEDEYEIMTSLIIEVMGGEVSKSGKKGVLSIIDNLTKKGAQAVLLGCTEIPLAINQEDVNIKLYNSLSILAESTVDYAHK